MNSVLNFIGHIETPYEHLAECPRNIDASGPLCKLIVKEELVGGLLGLSVGKKILILYWFENVDKEKLQQNSRKTGEFTGVFALRSPHRLNPIGAAVIKIEGIDKNVLYVKGLDCLNGTPLLDIKPANKGESLS